MAASNTQTVVTVVILLLVVLLLAYSVDPTFGGLLRVKQGFEGMPNVPVSGGDMPPGLMNNSGNANRNRNVDNQNAVPVEEVKEPFENMAGFEGPADFGSAESPAGCYPRDQLTPGELLPKDNNSVWAEQNPMGPGSLKGKNFLSAGALLGVNTVGQSLRNASWQLRSEPPNPQVPVSIFNQSTIQPDINRRPLEIN
jgi:hypothetical protein